MGVGWWFEATPWLVLCLWILHATLSWKQPRRIDPVGWLLLAGLPLAAVTIFVVETRLYPPGDVHPDDALLGPGFDLVMLSGELLLIWLLVVLFEFPLATTRQAGRAHAAKAAS